MADSTHVLVSSLNNQIQIINVLTEEEINRYTGHSNSRFIMDSCIYNNNFYDKTLLISGSEDGAIYAWDIYDDKVAHSFKVDYLTSENTSINNVTINENGLLAASGFPEYDNLVFYQINIKELL